MFESLRVRADKLKKDSIVLYLVFKDKRCPLIARILLFIILGYLVSPIDLIPDFIPVLGFIDDLILLPILIIFTIKFIPAYLMEEKKALASNSVAIQGSKLISLVIITMWLVLLILTAFWLLNFLDIKN